MTPGEQRRPDERPEGSSQGPTAIATSAPGRVLVVYATRHGSTAEVAEAVAEELRAAGSEVEVRTTGDDLSPEAFDAVVIGAPMIMGWHRHARRYVRRHRGTLARLPVAYFITAVSLTEDGAGQVDGVPVVKDPWLVKEPRRADKAGYKERYALPSHYVGDILRKTAPVRPLQAAFFAGSLDLTTMNLLEKVFVMLVVGSTPGDGRHWDAIREWARGLPAVLGPSD